ncbi:related to Ribonucleases P/MRP protein subunit POP5 [Saccharomycodes ludwigii]|uniref:Ribonuclease P/MRP protein subunit POP5 n=1 Tax=Saccharomycodes ludwigii TaxID=36035 RepID=A0A376B918_9ASCO|nr:hypothetical protein SCDLUD_000462 [Saccharomycodes ludwigii]KAH3902868.1 hypothetical protein SCDLUD_000462 [Saccharomycodes ludwigii]SSD61111.1 related to Ribonucleases P/MRP protein subunit POP5 [Saccharomycodes ludwigii]
MVRFKSRYVLFEIIYPLTEEVDMSGLSSNDIKLLFHKYTPTEVTPKVIMTDLKKIIQLYFGDVGLGHSTSMFQLKYFSNKTSTGIIRCSREDCGYIISGLTLMTKLGAQKNMIVNVIKVSGTMKKIEEFAIKWSKDNLKQIINEKENRLFEQRILSITRKENEK